jgi:thymidylate synthase
VEPKLTENAEIQYLGIMREILREGEDSDDRTGVGTRKLFGTRIVHDFRHGFPLLTTKKVFIKGVVGELLWFLKGTEDASYLIENKITIWDEWMVQKAIEDRGGNLTIVEKALPHTYGVKWRNFNGIDQIEAAVRLIKNNPSSRRIIVSAWDPEHIEQTALPWCHVLFQFNCRKDDYLDISVYQRSADWFLGVPFNIASYSYLLAMFCQQTGKKPGKLIYNFGDSHIYKNHFDQCLEQLSRENYPLPTLDLTKAPSLEEYKISDFKMVDYQHHPAIKAPVAV